MITYLAPSHGCALLTTTHVTPSDALDLAEADLLKGITPVKIVLASGIEYDIDTICDLLTLRRTMRHNTEATPCRS